MRSLIAVLVLLVSACTVDAQVTPHDVAKATEACESHAGLRVVTEADQAEEKVGCGRYCDKTTGRIQHHMRFICNDESKIEMSWFE